MSGPVHYGMSDQPGCQGVQQTSRVLGRGPSVEYVPDIPLQQLVGHLLPDWRDRAERLL